MTEQSNCTIEILSKVDYDAISDCINFEGLSEEEKQEILIHLKDNLEDEINNAIDYYMSYIASGDVELYTGSHSYQMVEGKLIKNKIW